MQIRGQGDREQLRQAVIEILATGTAVWSLVDMFAYVMRDEGYAEIADVLFEIAPRFRGL